MRYSVFVDHDPYCVRDKGKHTECIADGLETETLAGIQVANSPCFYTCYHYSYTDKQLSENDNLERFLDARILKLKEGIK